MMESKLSKNVLEEIHKYAAINFIEECPTLIVKVEKVERDEGRYWVVLLDGSGNEILAMLSKLLSQKIAMQDLIVKPIIRLNHYYLHIIEADHFVKNSTEPYVSVLGISNIDILTKRALNRIIHQTLINKAEKNRNKSFSDCLKVKAPDNLEQDEKQVYYAFNDFAGSGDLAVPISSLSMSQRSPLIRARLKFWTPTLTEGRNTLIYNCLLLDSSGGIACHIFSPISQQIKNLLKTDLAIEISDAVVRKSAFNSEQLSSNEFDLMVLNDYSKIRLFDGNNVVIYENSSNSTSMPVQQLNKKICTVRTKTNVPKLNDINPYHKSNLSNLNCNTQNNSNTSNSTEKGNIEKNASSSMSSISESVVGSGLIAVPLASLTTTKRCPLVRVTVKRAGPLKSGRGGLFVRCQFIDSSGDMVGVIFEPISIASAHVFKPGVMLEIENADVKCINISLSSETNNELEMFLNNHTTVRMYRNNVCVYKYP